MSTNMPELAHQTQYTRTGKLNMVNRKPYRTAAQKRTAKAMAHKCVDGAYRSSAPVSFHSGPRNRESA